MLQESFGVAEADMAARALREARVDADRLQAATATALAADGDLLTARSATRSTRCGGAARRPCRHDDRGAIEQPPRRWPSDTEAFAAERMNRGIRQALAGRRVEDL